jgi:AraC family transcriptional regulator
MAGDAAIPGLGGSWTLPGRRVLAWHEGHGFAAGIYDRGPGEGLWRGERERLVYSLTPRPAMDLQIEGDPVRRLPAASDPIGFYPAGLAVRTVGGDSRYAQLCWDPGLYLRLAPHLARPPSLEPAVEQDPLLGQLLHCVSAELEAGTLDRLLAETLLAAVAVRVLRRHGEQRPDIAGHRMRRVLEHIEAHLGEELSLETLAGIACLSPCHFSRAFKSALGEGPQRYVLRRRVERAKALLRQPELPLAQVAAELGFADQSHFTNVFRRLAGDTPARFRAALRP